MDTRSVRFRRYSAALAVATAGAAAYLIAVQGLRPASTVVLFALLMAWGVHTEVEVAGGVGVTPAFMIGTASIVAFRSTSSLSGPLVVGVCACLWLPQLRSRDWTKIAFNAGTNGLATLAAALGYLAVPSGIVNHMPSALLAVIPTTACYVISMWLLFAGGLFLMGERRLMNLVSPFAPASVQCLPFSVLGFFLGRLYLQIGAVAIPMFIVPILIAREMFASYMRVKESHEETVGMLIRALEAKDRYTAGHAERVADYARYMGEELNFMPARLERLRFAALMHDIGKLVVPNQLLNKPGRLTPEEFARVRIHEKVSVQMLSHIDFLRPIAGAAHSDNTKFDPDDEDHPIEPYIVMIADAYDAMTSTRSYRKALPQGTAFQELRDKAGIQFHPECVEALIRSIETRGEKHGAGFEEQDEFDNAPDAGLGSAGLGDLLPSESQAPS